MEKPKKMIVTMGVNVCAYTTITVEGVSLDELPAIARQVLESGYWKGKEIQFAPEWGTEDDLRIVSVLDAADNFLAENISCEEPEPTPQGPLLPLHAVDYRRYPELIDAVLGKCDEMIHCRGLAPPLVASALDWLTGIDLDNPDLNLIDEAQVERLRHYRDCWTDFVPTETEAIRKVMPEWNISTRWLTLYTTDGGGWLRLFRVGFGWKDTTKHRLTFSERNGHKRHLMIGKWSFGWLTHA